MSASSPSGWYEALAHCMGETETSPGEEGMLPAMLVLQADCSLHQALDMPVV